MSASSTPPQPSPGDLVVGCVHRPSPHGSHVIRVDPGVPFAMRMPVGDVDRETLEVWGEALANWIFVCDDCFDHYPVRQEIPIGCAMRWPEGATPLAYREPS